MIPSLPPTASARRLFLLLAVLAGGIPAAPGAEVPTPLPNPIAVPDGLPFPPATAGRPLRLDPVVTTATRNSIPIYFLGSAASILTTDELKRLQVDSLADALDATVGLAPATSGANGALTSLFLRGAGSNQTLILVDGIRVNDSNTDYAVYLGGTAVGDDSVEIVRGPQSTLYGSEAIGGVISVRMPAGFGRQLGLSTTAGSFGTWRTALAASNSNGDTDAFRLFLERQVTDNTRPNDRFEGLNGRLRLDHRISDRAAVGATVRWFRSRLGNPGDRFIQDPDDHSQEDQTLATVFADLNPHPFWTLRLTVGGQNRQYKQVAPPRGLPTLLTHVRNRRRVFDAQATFSGFTRHRLTGGLTAERSQTRNTGFGQVDRRQRQFAVFLQDEFSPIDRVFLTAGLRRDDFDSFGHQTTGRITAAWRLTSDLNLRGSWGTGFRAPSFLDLYGQSTFYVGNPDLNPERARGWDAGLDYFLPGSTGRISLTGFETRTSDLIVGDFTVFPSTVVNAARARSRGLELAIEAHPNPEWDARLAYTYLEAEDRSTGTRLLRRPRHRLTGDLWHKFGSGFSAGLGLTVVADAVDIDAQTYATVPAEDYAVLRLFASWQINDEFKLKVRAENLLDESYEPVNGYPANGFGLFAGADWDW